MTDTIRRHPDGSIDFDFYRADAVALRRQAMRDAGMRNSVRRASVGVLTALALGISMLVAFAPRQGELVAKAGAPASTHTVR